MAVGRSPWQPGGEDTKGTEEPLEDRDTLHLETPSLHSQPWLPIALGIMPRSLSLFLELMFCKPYTEDTGRGRESCQVCACESGCR